MKHFTLKTYVLLFVSLLFPAWADDDHFQKQPPRPVDLAHDKNLYVVGYAHLDTQWRWTYPYVIQNFIRNTMEQNFPLIEKYPNYIFNFSGSRRYEFMKEYYPEDYARVKQYVAAGRWFPCGSSVDENDANIPSLESMTRHFLYGNRFFQHEFGMQSQEYMLPDCFGFPASFPTILAHGGIKGFSTQKLTWGSAVGIPFNVGRWIGPDGSSIMAALNPGSYTGSVNDDLSKSQNWLSRITENGDKSGVYADYHYYGTGDRGGAPSEGSVKWMEHSLASDGPVRVIGCTADQIFKDITPEMAAKLPTYQGDLLLVNHSAGSLSSEAYMKRWNRKNELLANAAETAATAAYWLKVRPYPNETLYQAWDLILGSQMHDIMPGTSLPMAYEYSWNDEILALNQFASVTEQSVSALVAQMDTQTQGQPIAVYNPLSIDREDPVEASIPSKDAANESIIAFDAQGQAVPTQVLSRDKDSIRVLFLAKIPAKGCAIYDLRPGTSASDPTLAVKPTSLESDRYRVALDENGDIASIFDKELKRELLSAPARLSIHTENPAQYPAWNMDWEDRVKPARAFVQGPATVRVLESGPVRVALEVQRTTENSVFTQDIRLSKGSDRVEILDHIDWRGKEASLKADFPFSAANSEASYDDKVGVTKRSNNNPKKFEVPLQQWMDLTNADGSYGVTVMSDSKYGSDKPDDNTLRLTLIYTPGTRGGSSDQGTQDLGRHEILYAVAGHEGDWIKGKSYWQAARLNQPLLSFCATTHPGALGRTFSLLSLNTDQVQVVAVKKAEDSDEVILRFRELTGNPATGVSVHFPVPINAAREVDAQERPIGPATITAGQLVFDMKPYSLHAFALKLSDPTNQSSQTMSQPVTLTYDTDVISSRSNRADGAMNSDGSCYPAEMFPQKLNRWGVDFQLGPTADGQKNALTANGQTIELPSGHFNRVHLLVAADDNTVSSMKIGDAVLPIDVPNWTGFLGQWDCRIWDKPIQEIDYNPKQKVVGLTPGYIKRASVAWFCTHHNTPSGDAYYNYSYLFDCSYNLPSGAHQLTLPSDPKIRVFAISVSSEPEATPPAAPLYDTLADHQSGGAPIIPQDGQTFHDLTDVVLIPPLYHVPNDLHYTVDGTDPTASSPTYTDSIAMDQPVHLAVRQIDLDGNLGPITRGFINIIDNTPPQLTDLKENSSKNSLELTFSKSVETASAANPSNYVVQPPLPISKIDVASEGKVEVIFGSPVVPGVSYTMAISGIKDTSPTGNVVIPTTQQFDADNIVYALKSAHLPAQSTLAHPLGLPLKAHDAWTMNILVHPDAQMDHTLIAGFGDPKDGVQGHSRYLAIFDDGIRFWSSNRDVNSNSPLAIGQWQMLTAIYDGKRMSLYKDGQLIRQDQVELADDPEASAGVGITDAWGQGHQFQGDIQDFTIRRGALTPEDVTKLYSSTKPQ